MALGGLVNRKYLRVIAERRAALRRTASAIGMLALAALLLPAAGCRSSSSRQAVEAAIQAHLHQNSSLQPSSFNTIIKDVTFKGNQAEALVRFESKVNPNLVVEVRYQLERSGSNWVVKSGQPVSMGGSNPHQNLDQSAAPPGQTPPSTAVEPVPAPSH